MKPTQDSCYAEGRAPQIFLSLESPRERRALPYTLLLEVEISLDSSLLKLGFSHYEVLVRGSGLDVIYESVRAASCAVIKPGKAMDAYSVPLKTTVIVTEIRIKRLEPL